MNEVYCQGLKDLGVPGQLRLQCRIRRQAAGDVDIVSRRWALVKITTRQLYAKPGQFTRGFYKVSGETELIRHSNSVEEFALMLPTCVLADMRAVLRPAYFLEYTS